MTVNSKTKKILQIVNFAFILIALGLRIYNLFSIGSIYRLVADISGCLTLIAAIIYCVYGFKKDAAKFFKIYIWLYTIMSFIHIAIDLEGGTSYAVILLSALNFATAFVISVTEDLGREKTLSLGAINFASCAVAIIIAFATICNGSLEMIIVCIGQIIPAIIFNLMLLAKYVDKEERGTK